MNQFSEPCPTNNTEPCTDASSTNRLAQSRARFLAAPNDSAFAEYPPAQISRNNTDHTGKDNRGNRRFA